MFGIKKSLFFNFLLYFTIILIFIFTKSIFASTVLFSDDFSDGDSNGWTVTSSNSFLSVNANKYGGIVTSNFTVADSVAGDTSWTNYSYEVDMTAIQGGDINLLFRYTDATHRYGFHISGGSIKLEKVHPSNTGGANVKSEPITFNFNTIYHMKIVLNNDNIKIYQDDNLVLDYTDTSPMLQGKIGIRVGTGSIAPAEVWYDNIVVTEITGATPTPTATSTASPTATPTASPTPSPTPTATATTTASPTASPTPTPSPSPSPTPIIPIISVPNLKQYSEPWQSNPYDGYTINTIKQWGCALTSAAMVLQYHGHNVLPDALNTWLNGESDGYIGNGFINWLAISRYTKEHDSDSSPTLEYRRLSATENNLDIELNNKRPAILKEDGHFVVATGKLFNGVYTINDPGYSNRDDLSSYNNSFLALNSYTPTHSDLSYMMFVASSGVSLELVDSNGNVIATSFTEDPIADIDDPNNKSGESSSILLFEKPSSGNYQLRIKGDAGEYTLETYLYNVDGIVSRNSFIQTLLSDGTDTYDIVYTKENSDTNSIDILATISDESGVSSTYGTATVTWTTDKLSTSRVIFDTISHDSSGSAPNYGYAYSTATYNESSKVTSHSVTITGLGSNTLYYYRVISEGSPVSIGNEHTFRTLSKAGPPIVNDTQNNNIQVLGSDIFKKYIVYQDQNYNDQKEEKKAEKEEVLGSETQTAKTIAKHLDKVDIFLISLASFLILIIIGIRLLPEPTKKSK